MSFFFDNRDMRCTICKEKLLKNGNTFQCKNGHSFDQAKQGYVNLSRKQSKSGDNRAMVEARTRFLEKDYYDFMRQFVKETIQKYHPHTLVDIGCGQGYYTKTFIADEKYGIDLSKEAIAYASRNDKNTLYIVDSIYDLPFEDHSIDMVVSIFTPLPLEEIHRVLKKDGHLLLVSPGIEHLYELKDVLYEKVRLNDSLADHLTGFKLVEKNEIHRFEDVSDPRSLFEMTPYRYRSPKRGMDRLQQLDHLCVRFSFYVSVWKKEG